MGTETQQHPLQSGVLLTINRNDKHQYWLNDGSRVPGATGLLGHIDGDGFGAGIGWASKIIGENSGDTTAPYRVRDQAKVSGTVLHQDIEDYITEGAVAEDNPAFVSWMNELGGLHEWIAVEQFVFNKTLRYGGTADAFSLSPDGAGDVVIWDWKSKNATHRGSSPRDHAQLAAYSMALREMGSVYAPERGYIAYIKRDGSGVDVVPVDLERGARLFEASLDLFHLVKGAR
jgi:hypothetical protein